MFEFHVSRFSRDRYDFDQAIYQLSGNVILADFAAAREFSSRMNAARDLIRHPETAVSAGEIHAMGLIDEILHAVVADYRRKVDPGLMSRAVNEFRGELGADRFEQVLGAFTGHFPPVAVYQGHISPDDYLAAESGDLPNLEIALEELLMLWIANANPAFSRHTELFDDRILESQTAYSRLADGFGRFFGERDDSDGETESLLDRLMTPARKHPDSITAQLEYLLRTFPDLLEKYEVRILRSLDLLREESRPSFVGAGPIRVVDFARLGLGIEIEQFSPDLDWMPQLVLIAKNAHVWLDQLSKAHKREIKRLDQIPQEELELLSGRGFTGLWPSGLWERSPASKTSKHLTGNPDAVSSAYSLFDYTIAEDLGGEAAYETFRDRTARAGIRLAADMVPNHTGIYSKWVLEHPDWYISVDHSPYPVYSFEGPDLSSRPDIGIFLEEHYFSRSDAAVVFKRLDRRSGQTQFIYHGNDGTSMPWNDTAQLVYLNAQVREEVIRTILGVARKFSVIRFDAAMTLAKKHIQRLWFPEPGQGGAIPSRSEHGLTARQFDERIPYEFWREVVDRVAAEEPDTLLLAEAFWLMEGYFVRTLGMHRVYNSAFMNMLRDEKNAEYRSVIKNTLEFDPQILKRYVNFMNNPDEATAFSQFGKDGKYFGVCVLMATMPGLPMFGHGQVEGFHEKYGMEYQRAYYDETPDPQLVERHRREISPLLHRRAQFAEVDRFLLYDFLTGDGTVDENVFAYTNISAGERSLVIVHNKWGETRGRLSESTGFAVKTDSGKTRVETSSFASGLDFPDDPSAYVTFREAISGLEFIRSCAELHTGGFEVELGAFEFRVYLDFKVLAESEWSDYAVLADTLGGRGVTDLEAVRREIVLQPILTPWRRLLADDLFEQFVETMGTEDAESETETDGTSIQLPEIITGNPEPDEAEEAVEAEEAEVQTPFPETVREPLEALLNAAAGYLDLPADPSVLADEILVAFEAAAGRTPPESAALDRQDAAVLYCWLAANRLGLLAGDRGNHHEVVRGWLDDWLLGRALRDFLTRHTTDPESRYQLTALLITRSPAEWIGADARETIRIWLSDAESARYLNVNRYQGIVWFDAEHLENLIHWVRTLNEPFEAESDLVEILAEIEDAAPKAAYQVEALLAALDGR